MLPVHLSEAGLADVRERLRAVMVKPSLYADYGVPSSVIEDLIADLPESAGVWEVPTWAEALVRRSLIANPDVKRALRIAALKDQKRVLAAMGRGTVARKLFDAWHGVTNPELAGALWYNLNAEDRQVWLDRADEESAKNL